MAASEAARNDLRHQERSKVAKMLLNNTLISLVISFCFLQTTQSDKNPTWIEADPTAESFVAATETFTTPREVIDNRLSVTKDAISDWAAEHCGGDCQKIVSTFADEKLDALIKNEHIEIIQKPYEKELAKRLSAEYEYRYRGHFQIVIDDGFREQIETALNRSTVKSRIASTLMVAMLGFGSLGILCGYLRASKLTRGFYISRLRWIAGSLAIGLIVVCYVVYSFIR
jgi:hypothetical protein